VPKPRQIKQITEIGENLGSCTDLKEGLLAPFWARCGGGKQFVAIKTGKPTKEWSQP